MDSHEKQQIDEKIKKFKKILRSQEILSFFLGGLGTVYVIYAVFLLMKNESFGTVASVFGVGLAFGALGFAIFNSAQSYRLTFSLAEGLDEAFNKLHVRMAKLEEKADEILKLLKKKS
jgi:uncharacterized membrane protein